MGMFLGLASMVAFIVALWGVIFGRVRWAHLSSRRQAGAVMLVSMFTFSAAAAMSPTTERAEAEPAPTATVTVTAPPATVTATPATVTVTAPMIPEAWSTT
ncbi:MAG: hypothetical protein L0G22_07015, partial [Propionibacteriaceae bacterium]|nr:hypothetical protein [Propionibacteriaceae bacterium]